MRSLRSLSLLTAASAVLCAPFLISQTAAQTPAAPRIKGSVDETSLTTLKGNVSHVVQPQYDQGEASSSTQLNFVRLVLSRSPRQEAALEAFMAQQIDKSSPNYHHWLTPEQLGSLYGPADSDVAAIVAWLQSHGLKVETIPTSRTNIPFSGTVSQIEAAFHTPIHSYVRNGSQFYSNTADPRIPSALASVVIGVTHLNTLNPRSYRVGGGLGPAQ